MHSDGLSTGPSRKRATNISGPLSCPDGLLDRSADVFEVDFGVENHDRSATLRLGSSLEPEGFGEIAMASRTHRLLAEHAGREASVNGTTQIRAGVMRPEIVIPLAEGTTPEDGGRRPVEGLLETNTPVRVIRDPYFGLIGRVADLPSEPQVLGSESRARVLTVNAAGGQTVVVPRANIEIISE